MIDPSQLGTFPRHVVGVLSPLVGSDTLPYGFYRLLGPDFIIISTSLDLQSFGREDIERAVGAIDAALSRVLARGADIVLQSGTPLGISLGAKGLQELNRRLREKCGKPVLSSALNAVAAAQAVNARRLAVANKWNERLNRDLADFFSHWDIEVIESAAHAQEPVEFAGADLRKSAELAYRLGRQALERSPNADALFIGGGAWLVEPAAERLERETGTPVITHLNGAVRALLKELGIRRAFPKGFGRVLEAD